MMKYIYKRGDDKRGNVATVGCIGWQWKLASSNYCHS